jgi:hypothetical protein
VFQKRCIKKDVEPNGCRGVKPHADPFKKRFTHFVLGIANRFQELRILLNTANILRRACALTVDAARILLITFRRRGAFEFDLVLPAVAEIVGIHELSETLVKDAGWRPLSACAMLRLK